MRSLRSLVPLPDAFGLVPCLVLGLDPILRLAEGYSSFESEGFWEEEDEEEHGDVEEGGEVEDGEDLVSIDGDKPSS